MQQSVCWWFIWVNLWIDLISAQQRWTFLILENNSAPCAVIYRTAPFSFAETKGITSFCLRGRCVWIRVRSMPCQLIKIKDDFFFPQSKMDNLVQTGGGSLSGGSVTDLGYFKPGVLLIFTGINHDSQTRRNLNGWPFFVWFEIIYTVNKTETWFLNKV